MKLKETLNTILRKADQTLDKITDETPESRAVAKEKITNFFGKIFGNKKSGKTEEENEKNS